MSARTVNGHSHEEVAEKKEFECGRTLAIFEHRRISTLVKRQNQFNQIRFVPGLQR